LGDHIVVAYSKYGVKVSPQASFDPCSPEIQQSLRRNAQQGMGEEEEKTRKEDEGKERVRKREQEEAAAADESESTDLQSLQSQGKLSIVESSSRSEVSVSDRKEFLEMIAGDLAPGDPAKAKKLEMQMLAKEEVKLEEILELDVADGRVVTCVVVDIRKHPTLGDHIVVAYSKYGVKVSPEATFDPCSPEIQQSLRSNAQQGMGAP